MPTACAHSLTRAGSAVKWTEAIVVICCRSVQIRVGATLLQAATASLAEGYASGPAPHCHAGR